jgi:hypothetical protein
MTTVPRLRLRTVTSLAALVAVAAIAAGCTGTSTPSSIASAVTNATLPPVTTEAPTIAATSSPSAAASESSVQTAEPSESALPSAVATDIDPCQLITADEAGKLAGVTFGSGKSSTSAGHVKMCTYSAPGPNLFSVEVAVAPDEATAKAAEAAEEKDLSDQAAQMADLHLALTKLPNFAPDTDAALLEAAVKSPVAFGARAMFVLRGATFFGFSDIVVGGEPPSAQAMKDQATTALGKLP